MERTNYMQQILTATYSQVPLLSILRGLKFEDCWPTAIGELLEKAVNNGGSEAEVIMQSIGIPPYSKEDYLKAARMIMDSTPPDHFEGAKIAIDKITEEDKPAFIDPREAVKQAYKES